MKSLDFVSAMGKQLHIEINDELDIYISGGDITQPARAIIDVEAKCATMSRAQVRYLGKLKYVPMRVQHLPDEVIKLYTDAQTEYRERPYKMCPGLHELEASISDWDRYHDDFNLAMEEGDGWVPKKPKTKTSELAIKYPRAAAYIKAQEYSHAFDYRKAAEGREALKRLLAGEDETMVIKDMEEKWSAAALDSMWN